LSTLTTASSTTKASAITNPASDIMFSATPNHDSSSIVTATDTPTVTRLTTAARQLNSSAASTSSSRIAPSPSVMVTLSTIDSMKPAGRYTVVSISRPGSAGRISSSASSTARVTSAILLPGYRSTTSMMLGASLTIASPMSSWWSSTIWATSPSTTPRSSAPSTVTLARSAAVLIG
jgi:hypothetical protein